MAGELSYTAIKALIDAYIKVNGNREITPPLHNLIETALANSNLNKKDGGILEALTYYNSAFSITDPLTLVYKSYVDDLITALDALTQGTNTLTEELFLIGDIVTMDNLNFENSTMGPQVMLGNLSLQGYGLNNSFFGDNVYFDGSNFRYTETGFGTLFYMEADGFSVRTVGSGTAGNVASLTTKFQVKNDGRILVRGNPIILYGDGTNDGDIRQVYGINDDTSEPSILYQRFNGSIWETKNYLIVA